MQEIILIIGIIALLLIAYFYIKSIYIMQLQHWRQEITLKKILFYSIPIILKSAFALFLIVLIHNNFHSDHILELALFISVFFLFSLYQSSFSISGFFNRNKYVYASFVQYVLMTSSKIKSVSKLRIHSSITSVFIRALILIGFLVLMVPQVSLLITLNILFLIIIAFMIVLSLLQNNFIYFGLVSLLIFRVNEELISFSDMPYVSLILSYLILLIGAALETRLNRRMFTLITIMPVKRFNFKLGYDLIHDTKSVLIYQNVINKYYYVYYRKLGIVVVYYAMYDPSISWIVIHNMISYGKETIRSRKID
jgi:hypothetical protein